MIERRQAAYDDAIVRMEAAQEAIDTADEGADLDALQGEFDEAVAEAERTRGALDEAKRIHDAAARARKDAEVRNTATPPAASTGDAIRAWVGREEPTYRPDGHASFFRDIITARQGDTSAAARLERHRVENIVEKRDVTTADPGAAGFIPPIYLASAWAELPRAGRPFADACPKMPLPDAGMTLSIPKVQTGVTVASQASENAAVSETDIDTQTVSVSVRTIAGLNDISVQAMERSFPGMDQIIFNDLRRAYDAELDRQLLNGTGASGQHLGIRAVSGVNTVTYTDASPTTAEALPKLYDAIQKVEANRFSIADTIVMHPRRSAWFASNLSSTFPLFQLGSLTQASGTQGDGMATSLGGLRVIRDANVGTLLGAGTEDEVYVLSMSDLILMEGGLRADVFPDVGSSTLTVRLRLFAYSAFASARQPTAITVISGTGLIAPTF